MRRRKRERERGREWGRGERERGRERERGGGWRERETCIHTSLSVVFQPVQTSMELLEHLGVHQWPCSSSQHASLHIKEQQAFAFMIDIHTLYTDIPSGLTSSSSTANEPFCIFSKPRASAQSAIPPATRLRERKRAVLPVEQLLLQLVIGIPVRPVS